MGLDEEKGDAADGNDSTDDLHRCYFCVEKDVARPEDKDGHERHDGLRDAC